MEEYLPPLQKLGVSVRQEMTIPSFDRCQSYSKTDSVQRDDRKPASWQQWLQRSELALTFVASCGRSVVIMFGYRYVRFFLLRTWVPKA